jgi:hypothetical protein
MAQGAAAIAGLRAADFPSRRFVDGKQEVCLLSFMLSALAIMSVAYVSFELGLWLDFLSMYCF